MIRRNKFKPEFKRKIALEILSGARTVGVISKQEGISATTLYKWRDKYCEEDFTSSEMETAELKNRIRELEETISDLALENHILKKTEKLLKALRKKENSSGSISFRNSELKQVVK